jgi:hypothetical protein
MIRHLASKHYLVYSDCQKSVPLSKAARVSRILNSKQVILMMTIAITIGFLLWFVSNSAAGR